MARCGSGPRPAGHSACDVRLPLRHPSPALWWHREEPLHPRRGRPATAGLAGGRDSQGCQYIGASTVQEGTYISVHDGELGLAEWPISMSSAAR